MKRFKLILCGSNKFVVGSPLNGCINDLKAIYNLCKVNPWFPSFDFYTLQNDRFTKKAFLDLVYDVLGKSIYGDEVWIHFSSHGTVIPVNNENHTAIVTAKSTWDDLNSFILDEDLKLLAESFRDIKIFITADACESADLAFRLLPSNTDGVNRFVDAPEDVQMMIDHNGATKRALVPPIKNVAYVSGCGPKGFYSADVGTGANAYGLFTKTFCEIFKPGMTAQEIATECRVKMPNDQQPEAHGGLKDVQWILKED